jgi:cytochrome c oxidase cbb3-type subunit 3
MYKETLRGIAGVGLFPAISLLLFVLVFTIMLIRVLRMDRADAQRLAALPLEEGASASTSPEVAS